MIRIGVYCPFYPPYLLRFQNLELSRAGIVGAQYLVYDHANVGHGHLSVAVGVGTIFREAAGFLLGLHYLTLYGAWGLLSDVSVG